MNDQPVFKGTHGTYVVRRPLGEGGFGETFLAVAESDGSEVVVKRLKVDRLDDWKAIELFEREARVLESLDHPNIPDYVDAFPAPDGNGLVLVQQFIDGKTLRAFLRDGEEIDEASMTRWFLKILEVLSYLHALDPPVIHRDVNPNNIILRSGDGEPFLIDFGTVQAAIKSESTISSTAAGTFGYAPTEQFIGKSYPSSDLHGLAMTFLAVWTGTEPEEMPFAGGAVQLDQVLRARPMDGRLKLALEKMIDRVAENRPKSAEEVLSRLAALRGVPKPAPPTRPASSGPDANPWVAAKERLSRLAPESVLGDVSQPQPSRYLENCAVNARGTLILLSTGGAAPLVDTESMVPRTWLRRMEGDAALGFAVDDSFLIAFHGWREEMRRVDLATGEMETFEVPEELQRTEYRGPDAPIAISPDGNVGALGSPLALFDPRSAALIRVTQVESEAPPCFSADGKELVGIGDDEIVIMRDDESRQTMKGTCFVYSADGRRFALATASERGCGVSLGERGSTSAKRIASVPDSDGAEIRRLAFDPTGRWLAIGMSIRHTPPDEKDWTWCGRVLVLDTETNAFTTDLMEPSREGHAFDDVFGLAFDAKSERLFVHADCFATLGDLSDAQTVIVHDFRANRILALVDPNGMRTPEGFFSPFAKEPAVELDPADPYRDLAWRAACGHAPDTYLEGEALDRLLDLRQRVEFLQGLFRAPRDGGLGLPKQTDLRPLLEATRGLTHLMPWVQQEAERIVAALPAFGGKQPVRVEHLLEAANRLSARAADERDVLFEEMLADEAVQADARRRASEAKAQKKASDRTAVREQEAGRESLVKRPRTSAAGASRGNDRPFLVGFGIALLLIAAGVAYAFIQALQM